MNNTISIIVPCYNEQESLPVFTAELTKVLKDIGYEYELVIVDDGSSDWTLLLLEDFAESDAHITYLSFSRNFGKEAATYAGFCNVEGDYVAVMDVDISRKEVKGWGIV